MTEQQPESPQDDLLSRLGNAFDAAGIEAFTAALKSIDDPKLAARACNDVLQNLYQTRKDVTGMIAVADTGLAFCLHNAKQAVSPEDTEDFNQIAKIITYNAGANCWPGWGDAGVEISPAHIHAGLRLAYINRDLAREWQLGPVAEANGTWLVGALQLAAGKSLEAVANFRETQKLAESAGKTDLALMAAGYCALARKATPITASQGAKELASALTRLREHGSQDTQFFAEQIVTADRILLTN
jgi:hypothetical protein